MSWKNLVDWRNVIRFIRRAIVEFNYYQVLELNSSELNSTAVRRINRAFIIVRTNICLFICAFVSANNSNHFRMDDLFVFLAPLFLLNYFLFNLFLFLRKSGGSLAPPPPSPSLCAVPV